jgi:hypothetical protein
MMESEKDLMTELLSKAKAGEHIQFQFITTWKDYIRLKKIYRANQLLITSINKSATKLFRKHCKAVAAGKADVTNLLAYKATIKVLDFYEEELGVIFDMLDEYEAYLFDGNFISAFLFGDPRLHVECYDWRQFK